MPSEHGLWLDHNDSIQAARPYAAEKNSERPVQSGPSHWGSLVALEDVQLMTKREELAKKE